MEIYKRSSAADQILLQMQYKIDTACQDIQTKGLHLHVTMADDDICLVVYSEYRGDFGFVKKSKVLGDFLNQVCDGRVLCYLDITPTYRDPDDLKNDSKHASTRMKEQTQQATKCLEKFHSLQSSGTLILLQRKDKLYSASQGICKHLPLKELLAERREYLHSIPDGAFELLFAAQDGDPSDDHHHPSDDDHSEATSDLSLQDRFDVLSLVPKVYTNHRRHYIPQAAKGGEGRSLFHMAIQYTLNDDHEQAAATLLSIPNVVPEPSAASRRPAQRASQTAAPASRRSLQSASAAAAARDDDDDDDDDVGTFGGVITSTTSESSENLFPWGSVFVVHKHTPSRTIATMNDYEQKPSGENVVLRSVYVHTILYHDHQEHRPSGKCSCTRQRIRDKVLVPGVDATAQDEPALECEHIASLKMYTESDLALAVDHEPVCHLPGRRVSVSPACDVENVGIVTLPTAQDSSRIRCGCRDAKDKSTDLTIRGRHVEALRKANLSQLCCVHLDAVMVYLEEHRLQQLLYPKADSINAKDLYLDIRTGKFQESDQESPNHRYTPVLDEPLLLKKKER